MPRAAGKARRTRCYQGFRRIRKHAARRPPGEVFHIVYRGLLLLGFVSPRPIHVYRALDASKRSINAWTRVAARTEADESPTHVLLCTRRPSRRTTDRRPPVAGRRVRTVEYGDRDWTAAAPCDSAAGRAVGARNNVPPSNSALGWLFCPSSSAASQAISIGLLAAVRCQSGRERRRGGRGALRYDTHDQSARSDAINTRANDRIQSSI